jgi:hypothetical protein
MKRALFAVAALALVVVLAAPFVRDAYTRYRVMHRLAPVMTEQDRIAFRSWNGDAVSFAKSLYARCELDNGRDSPVCSRYIVAFE